MTSPSGPAASGPRPAVLIVNTASRTGQADFEVARRRLTDLGLPLIGAHAVDNPADLPRIVDEAIRAGAELVVLGGGDGSVSGVVSQLVDRDVVLGLLPTGTANDLARALQLPTDLLAACDVVVGGQVTAVDLGMVGTDYFVNVAAAGLSAEVTHALSPVLKRRLGALAYPIATVRAYFRQRPFRVRLEFPDGDHESIEFDDVLQVAVANSGYFGGRFVVPADAGVDDERLDVYAIRRGTVRQRWQIARHFSSGAITQYKQVPYRTTRAVRLITEPEQELNVDGELSARTPILFGLRPGALRVMVPAAVS